MVGTSSIHTGIMQPCIYTVGLLHCRIAWSVGFVIPSIQYSKHTVQQAYSTAPTGPPIAWSVGFV